jgi:Zn-dependent metalloprotease
MKGYVHTMSDNGGVHINSGIPNHAFYLAAINIGGNAWERAGKIWYTTLIDPHLKSNANFRAFANLTISNAARIFGASSKEENAVHDAWRQVGVL